MWPSHHVIRLGIRVLIEIPGQTLDVVHVEAALEHVVHVGGLGLHLHLGSGLRLAHQPVLPVLDLVPAARLLLLSDELAHAGDGQG